MSRRAGQCVVAASLLTAAACNAGPEVVATESAVADASSDAYLEVPIVDQCKAGYYVGSFVSDVVDSGAPPLALRGTMSFTLVLSPSVEFLQLDPNSKLEATSMSPLADISAEIRGDKPCAAGVLHTDLVNGKFVAGGAGGIPFDFVGSTDGVYYPDPPPGTFTGTWQVDVQTAPLQPAPLQPEPLHYTGTWAALWAGRKPPAP